jgi:hypothetical protein
MDKRIGVVYYNIFEVLSSIQKRAMYKGSSTFVATTNTRMAGISSCMVQSYVYNKAPSAAQAFGADKQYLLGWMLAIGI